MHAGRAVFLTHFNHDFGIEAKLTALFDDGVHGGHVDSVLALVISGAATVESLAIALRFPRPSAFGPLIVEAANDIAMPVSQHGRQCRIFDP